MIFGYVRRSTAKQAISPQRQVVEMERWAADKNLIIDQVFEEKPITGSATIAERPALSELLMTIGKGDTLLVLDITRLSRSQMVMNMVLGMLHTKGAGIAFADGHEFDEDCMVSRLMTNILAFCAEWEKKQLQNRTKQALSIIKKHKALGRPDRCKWGWRNLDGKQVPHKKEQEIGILVQTLRNEGTTFANIAKQLKVLGHRTRTGGLFTQSAMHRLCNTFQKA